MTRNSGAHRRVAAVLVTLALSALLSIPTTGAVDAAKRHGARYLGSPAGHHLAAPVVGLAATPTGDGYWLVASDGGVFTFGDATFHGSTGGLRLAAPIVGMTPTPTGRGYRLVASDGGVFTFGDATFHGSTGGLRLAAPIVGMAPTPTGRGYWLVASDGGVFTFGDAEFLGALGGRSPFPIVGITPSPGRGYWLVASDGLVFAFGDAPRLGSMGGQPINRQATGIAAARRGGYWVVTESGAIYTTTASGDVVRDPMAVANDPSFGIASELFDRVNAERGARGLRLLRWDPTLAGAATRWSFTMAAQGSMYHQDLRALLAHPSIAGRYGMLAENIYNGNGIYRDAGSAHVTFMRSDSHRRTLLTPELTSVGIGAVCSAGRLWVAQEFGVWSGYPLPGARPAPPAAPLVRGDENGRSCP